MNKENKIDFETRWYSKASIEKIEYQNEEDEDYDHLLFIKQLKWDGISPLAEIGYSR